MVMYSKVVLYYTGRHNWIIYHEHPLAMSRPMSRGKKIVASPIIRWVFLPQSPFPYRFWRPDLVPQRCICLLIGKYYALNAYRACLVLGVFIPCLATMFTTGVSHKPGYAQDPRLPFTSPHGTHNQGSVHLEPGWANHLLNRMNQQIYIYIIYYIQGRARSCKLLFKPWKFVPNIDMIW